MNPLKDLRASLPRLAFMAACTLLSATLPDLAQAGGGLQRVNHFMRASWSYCAARQWPR